jgi:elongation factor G
VYLRIEPLPRGVRLRVPRPGQGRHDPGQFIPAVEKGVREVLAHGAIAGHPVVDVRLIVYDGKHHSVDSKEIAFVTAGRKAFLERCATARPIVLEPIVHVEINAPGRRSATSPATWRRARGMVSGTANGAPGTMTVRGQAPMSGAARLPEPAQRADRGQGRYTVEFSHYEAVPANTQQRLVGEFKVRDDD